MGWIFASVLVICVTVITHKVIDEGCEVDVWCMKKDVERIKESVAKIEMLLEEGGK